jgi:signal transduction histidine kinase
MSLLQQAIQLLSEAPGNIVYHLVTLFALQVVFALSVNHWQRDRTDRLALRMAWAAGAVFLARAGLLLAGVIFQGSLSTAVAAIAPIEQAVHTITILFLIWAFVPHSKRYPRFGHLLLGLAVTITGVMTLSFVQTWQIQAGAGEAYNGTPQATIWGIVQLIVLGLGLVFLLQQNRLRLTLPVMIVGLLFLAHVAHFWNYPEILPTTTDVPYWIRLGHFIVLPLWAAWVYRYTLMPLLAAHEQPAAVQVARSLNLATEVISTLELETAVSQAVDMAARMTGATFAGIALSQEDNPKQLHLTCTQGQTVQLSGVEQPRSWFLNLEDWPSFRQVLAEKQAITLKPEGMGARQLRDWYQEMGVTPLGPLFIQPLQVQQDILGLLLLAGPGDRTEWDEAAQILAGAVAGYVARVVDNGRYLSRAGRPPLVTMSPMDTAVSGRIMALEEERSQLKAELGTTVSRMQQAEMRAVTANKQARDLAATLAEMDQINRSEQVEALEMEIEALRESLIEAEEAMALAAASEGELSTEWVMHTITRYSGQLEEAQERIQSLELTLAEHTQGPVGEIIISLVQELRTPMTSIAGYTDILLAERVGILGVRQREFVQRVQANTVRMGVLLDQLVQLITTADSTPSRMAEVETDVEEVIDTAVNTVLNQIREKNLRLELKISSDLPLLPVNHHDLRQIVTSLLGNACQSSANDSGVVLKVLAGSISPPHRSENGQSEQFNFLHLAVTDSGGGIRVEDRSRVFDPQHDADSPLIAGLGDTGAALSVARVLAEANGGRLWVDSMMGVGSTFSAVFPLSLERMNGETAVSGESEGD